MTTKQTMRLLAGALLMSSVACGPDEATPRVQVSLFGWGPTAQGGEGFVTGMPAYEGAQTVRVKVTQPMDRRILSQSTFDFAARGASMPEITYGERLRLDFEVFDGSNNLLAAGATPIFTFQAGSPLRNFRAMVAPVDSASPVGSLILDSQTQQTQFVQSAFDYRGESRDWLGRIGHASETTSDGEVLIVGGGNPGSFYQPFTAPNLTEVYDDIQVFSPVTGYFTSLAQDDASEAVGVLGRDKLAEPRAFHTVTPLGNDRFLVAGGYTIRSGETRAVNTLELIDLNEAPGTRVRSIVDFNGNPIRLETPRAHHSATRRTSDGAVVIAGGLSRDGSVLNTFEVVNVEAAQVNSGLQMTDARVGHSAVLLRDGRTVWLAGGRSSANQVLATSEEIVPTEASSVTTTSVPLNQARFGAAARRISSGGGDLVIVIGGFTGATDGGTATFEVGRPSQGQMLSEANWRINQARGSAALVELPQTGDLLLLGGLDPGRQHVNNAERLTFQGLTAVPPFQVSTLGDLHQERFGITADVTSNGRVLITGGMSRNNNNVARHDAEYFNAYDPVRPPL